MIVALGGIGATDEQITALVGSIGAAIPVAGPFIALAATIAVAVEKIFSGCGATCTQATQYVNQAQAALAPLFDAYMAAPIHYASMQAAYLNTFDQAWAYVLQNCGNPQLGTAGQNCISQRQAGGCVAKVAPFGWQQNSDGTYTYVPAGASGSGSTCWNWFSGMRDPIANDPTVVPDPVGAVTDANGNVTSIAPTAGTSLTSLLGGSTSSSTDLLYLAGGLALLLLWKVKG